MTTLADLVDGAYRDLGDEAKQVFSTILVEDFIRAGIVDINRVAPQDMVYEIPFVEDPDTGVITQFIYDTPIQLAYRVELQRISDGFTAPIAEPVEGYSSETGWVWKRTATGGSIEFSPSWLAQVDPDLYAIRIHGYGAREIPYDTDPDPLISPTVGLSKEEEYSVRAYAKQAGYDLLAHDRSLFAQWQGQTNNTDVSPTQITQMAQNSKQEWDRQRGLIRVVRRYW